MRLFQPDDHRAQEDPRLPAAAAAGDVARVKKLLASGVFVDARDDEDYTALMVAAGAGHRDVFEALLRAGADPSLDAFGETALTLACSDGRLKVVRSWIAHGLPLTQDNDDAIQALLAAASAGHVDVIRCLVAAGVRANDAAIEYASELGPDALALLQAGGAMSQ
jgi:uncharacterized protein